MRPSVAADRNTRGWDMDPGLVGRDPELSRLRAFVAAARQSGSALIVTGEAGLGKSALLNAAVRRARAVGGRAVTVAGTGSGANRPLSALAPLIDPVLSEPGLLSPDAERALAAALGARSGSLPSPLLVGTAALSAARHASRAGPLLIAVDDAQWLDDASAEVLAFVARRLHGSAVGLLAASLPDNGPLTARGRLPTLPLTRLTDDAARDLLALRYPDLSAPGRERLVTEAEGNPLALVELPLLLVGEQQRLSPGTLPAILPMTGRLRAMFEPRLAGLSADTLRLLLVLALGNSGDPCLLRRATGLDVRESLRPAQAAGLVAVHPLDGYASFRQPLMRSAVVAVSSDQERRHAHRLLAGAVGESHGVTLGLVGAAPRADRRTSAPLKAQMVDAHLAFNAGDLAGAYRMFTGALRRHGSAADQRSLDQALEILAMVCYFTGSDEMWSGLRRTVAEQGSWAPACLRLTAELGGNGARPPAALVAELDAAVDRLPGEEDPQVIVQVAAAAVALDRGAACKFALRHVLDGTKDGSTTASTAAASYLLAEISLAAGDAAEARKVAASGLAACRSADHVPYAMILRTVEAMSAAVSGDRGALEALIEPVLAWATPTGAHPLRRAAYWARAREALGRSDHASAHGHLIGMAGTDGLERLAGRQPRVLFDLVDATAGSGHPDVARACAARAARAVDTSASPRWDLIATGALALVDDRDPIGLFERAVTLRGADRWPFDLARIRLAYGERLRRLGALEAARAQLNFALDTFHALQAGPWIARAADQLRDTGEAVVGIIRTGPAREPLTGQEERIAALAASGLTNRDIAVRLHLSDKTIGCHLHQVFHKLGVTSRAQLRDALTGSDGDNAKNDPCSRPSGLGHCLRRDHQGRGWARRRHPRS